MNKTKRLKRAKRKAKESRETKGSTLNPLKKVSQNILCICDSKQKVKDCCGKNDIVSIRWANKVQNILNSLTQKQKLLFGYKS